MKKAILPLFILLLGSLSGCFDFLKEKEDDDARVRSSDYDGAYTGIVYQDGAEIGTWEMSIEDGFVFGNYFDGTEWVGFNGEIYEGGELEFELTLSDGTLVEVSLTIDSAMNVSGTWSDSDNDAGTVSGSQGSGGNGKACTFSTSTGVVDGELGDSGELTSECAYTLGNLTVTSLTLAYEMDIFFGEALRKAAFKWEGEGSLADVLWGAAVVDAQGNPITVAGQPVYVSWEEGTYKGPGEGFGWDVSGSPAWSDVFLFFDESEREFYKGIDAETAKNIYKQDFTLSNLMILKINYEPVN